MYLTDRCTVTIGTPSIDSLFALWVSNCMHLYALVLCSQPKDQKPNRSTESLLSGLLTVLTVLTVLNVLNVSNVVSATVTMKLLLPDLSQI